MRQGDPVRVGTMPEVGLRGDERPEHYGVRLSGLLRVPRDTLYTFHLPSDDGARLRVAGEVIVDHDGKHGESDKQGQIALRTGAHPIVVYFQADGGAALRLELSGSGLVKRPVSREWFAHVEREPPSIKPGDASGRSG
jgi:hypothetical protein